MVLLGLLLLVAAVLVVVGAAAGGVTTYSTDTVDITAFDRTLSGVSMSELFPAGAVTGLLAGLGFALLVRGLSRQRRLRGERRRTMTESQQTARQLEQEKQQLAEQLEQERVQRAQDTAVYPTDAPLLDRETDAPVLDRETDAPVAAESGRHRRFGR